jgi:hypothetical protein
MTKKEIRKIFREKRLNLNDAQVEKMQDLVAHSTSEARTSLYSMCTYYLAKAETMSPIPPPSFAGCSSEIPD